jgi:hypothetical protein
MCPGSSTLTYPIVTNDIRTNLEGRCSDFIERILAGLDAERKENGRDASLPQCEFSLMSTCQIEAVTKYAQKRGRG